MQTNYFKDCKTLDEAKTEYKNLEVNLETDMFARYIFNMFAGSSLFYMLLL